MEHEFDLVGGVIDLGAGLHTGKGKTKITKIIGERFDGLAHIVGVVSFSSLHTHQRLELIISSEVVAFELNARHHKTVSLGDVHRDHNALPVR